MNSIRNTTLSVSILLLSGFCIAPTEWLQFENADCQLQFPVAPQQDSTVTETSLGKFVIHTYVSESPENANDSNLVYQLVQTEYPDTSIRTAKKEFIKAFLDGAVKGAVKSLKGKLLSSREISMNEYPGREIKVDCEDGAAVVSMKMILVKTKMFALQTISVTGKDNNSNAARFFSSFRLK